ncbi:hypothetical protein ACFOOK_31495 [Micromonospora krabiensis]|uniref:hypothetical protein n=1 Tax=Micromonospora krabiensis TaxID=307121 RepID=UPI00361FDEE6
MSKFHLERVGCLLADAGLDESDAALPAGPAGRVGGAAAYWRPASGPTRIHDELLAASTPVMAALPVKVVPAGRWERYWRPGHRFAAGILRAAIEDFDRRGGRERRAWTAGGARCWRCR